MDFGVVVDALRAAESGAQGKLLSHDEAVGFLDAVGHFRRSVAYAAFRLTAELTRHLSGAVRARATAALAGWVSAEPLAVEQLLLVLVIDRDPGVRAAAVETLGVLLASVGDRDDLIDRWRRHSRAAASAVREARRLQID